MLMDLGEYWGMIVFFRRYEGKMSLLKIEKIIVM